MGMRAIFYDTETTGIRASSEFIIEIAAYDAARDISFEAFVKPRVPIPPEATRVHGITDEMVADAPGFDVVGKKFVEFCEGDVVLIAHNNDGFDIHFLREEFKRNNLSMPSWNFLDSLKWARRYRPDLPRHSLQFLREIYGIQSNNAHRALDDVRVLYQVFMNMTDDLPIDQVYRLLNQPRKILHMPFGKHQGEPLKTLPRSYVKWLNESGALDKEENLQLRETFNELGLLSPAKVAS